MIQNMPGSDECFAEKYSKAWGIGSGAGGMQFQREWSGISLSDKVISECELQWKRRGQL